MNQLVERHDGLLSDVSRNTAAELKERVNVIQQIMRDVMKQGTHYGTIPGTPKPTLYKAGAEILCQAFRIAQVYIVEDLSGAGFVRYRVRCIGRHQLNNMDLGEGLGECSSGEEKYKWKAAPGKDEFERTPEHMRRMKSAKMQIMTEPADLANTVLKMACKRAMVAMTLNVTAASDMFTQDLEDMPEELRRQESRADAGDPELLFKWVSAADSAEDIDALRTVRAAGLAEIKAAKDMPAYNAFKAAIEERRGILASATKQEDAA